MKRIVSVLVLVSLVLLILSMTACSPQTQTSVSPTPEPELFVPEDIFDSRFDPYADVAFPDNFTVYAAMFDIGIEKLGGTPHFTLSMTAENKTEESIKYLAGLAGLEDEEVITSHLDGFLSYGYCEFQDPEGSVFAIRRTDRHDDRYEYVEGLHADITVNISEEDVQDHLQLFRDCFSVNALTAVSGHFDTTPLFDECVFAVNLHKREVRMDMLYPVSDTETVWDKITENVQFTWYDTQNGKMGFSYGIFDIQLVYDKNGGNIYVTESTSVMDSVLSAYAEPEVSLSKLGFGFGQDGLCGVYEQREPHYTSVAVHRPEWGEFNEDWNIEFLDELNGYMLRITYFESEDKFHISADKDGSGAAFDYYIQPGKYDGEFPDKEMVSQFFNDAFGTEGEGFYYKPVEHLERLVQDQFGMSVLELYELPAK